MSIIKSKIEIVAEKIVFDLGKTSEYFARTSAEKITRSNKRNVAEAFAK
jgi:hypothetical protein